MWDKGTAITSLNRARLCETKKKEPFCECRRNNPHALFYFNFLSPFSSHQLLRGFMCRSYTLQTETINASNQSLVILFYHCCIATAKQNKNLKPNKNQQAYTKTSFCSSSSSNQIYKSSFLTAAYVFKSVQSPSFIHHCGSSASLCSRKNIGAELCLSGNWPLLLAHRQTHKKTMLLEHFP